MKKIALLIGLACLGALTGCLDGGVTPQQQANFDAKMNAMTPEERIAYIKFIMSLQPQRYDVTVHEGYW